jgi:trimeric autotransporter adhesin
LDAKKELRNMTSANIQRKNTFLNWGISIAIGLVLSADLNATAGTGYQIETIAGDGTASFSGEGIAATAARLNNPFGIFVHSSGDTYFADTANHRIRKITASNGIISTIAGTGTASFSGDGAAATDATLNAPNGVYVDGSGNVYIADTGNQRIRKITGSTISTIAGSNSTAGFADGTATTTARFSSPYGVFVDSANNVYIADTGNHRIRKLSGTTVSTIAGTGTAGFADGAATTAARFSSPRGIWADSTGTNIYIADYSNHLIRKLTGTSVTTIAGTNSITTAGYSGDGSLATTAYMSNPGGICRDLLGNIYFADTGNNCIRMFTVGGNISTLSGFSTGLLQGPKGICIDSSNNLYIANTGGNNILKRTSGGTVSTLSFGTLTAPQGVFADSFGNVFVANTGGNNIRMLWGADTFGSGAGQYAQNSVYTIASDLSARSPNNDNNPAINSPVGIWAVGSATPASIRVYFIESGRYRFFNPANTSNALSTVSTIAMPQNGNTYVGIFGVANTATNTDTLYFTTGGTANNIMGLRFNHQTKMLQPPFITVGSSTTAGFSGDGGAANVSVRLRSPYGIFVDSSNNVYVADSGNNRIRTFSTAGGNISTIAGPNGGYSGDGSAATSALLKNPSSVFVNGSTVYVADSGNSRIRTFSTAGGNISTIAGTGTAGFADGAATSTAMFSTPQGVAADTAGNIFIADSGNNRIRKLTVAASTTQTFTVATGASQTLSGTLSKAFIAGGGTAVLPTSNTISAVEVNNGTLQVSGSAPITFNASGGSAIVEILAAINTGAFTFNTPGAVKIGTGIAAILDAPSGSGTMSKTGPGTLRVITDLRSSTTPIAISQGVLEVSGASGKLPNTAISVANGSTLQLGTSGGTVAASAVANASVASGGIMSILAGATGAVTSADISSGGIVSVAAGVTAPSGMFTSATFRSGGILQVADGATLGQSFTSVP